MHGARDCVGPPLNRSHEITHLLSNYILLIARLLLSTFYCYKLL